MTVSGVARAQGVDMRAQPAVPVHRDASDSRAQALANALDGLDAAGAQTAPARTGAYEEYLRDKKNTDNTHGDTGDPCEKPYALEADIGYLKGKTLYNFAHQTSELKYPLDNWMFGAGGRAAVPVKNLSLHGRVWLPLERDAGAEMTDRDWISGLLVSETKSQATLDAFMADIYARYDFYIMQLAGDSTALTMRKGDEVKIGALLGYMYEQFDYDLYNLYYNIDLLFGYGGRTLYQGVKVLTYKIRYHIPYLGLAADIRRKTWGLGAALKYALYPTAYDKDNHVLRDLVFYGNYNKNGTGWLFSLRGHWRFYRAWRLKCGWDLTYVKIDGKTWEEHRDPVWEADQSTKLAHSLFWSGIEYGF